MKNILVLVTLFPFILLIGASWFATVAMLYVQEEICSSRTNKSVFQKQRFGKNIWQRHNSS